MGKQSPNDNFGLYLRMLRKRARITQRDFGIVTGYSEGQICRFEQGHKPPDLSTLVALFVPALNVKDAPRDVARLLELAAEARDEMLTDKQISSTDIALRLTLSTPPLPVALSTPSKMGKREREAHLAAARWALSAEGDVIAAARHYLNAGDIHAAIDVLNDRGVALFNQGQWESAAQVIDQLLAHIDRALPSSEQSDAMRCQLYEVRGDLLLHTVRADEAQQNFEAALALADGAVHAKLAHKLCVCFAQRGKPSEALALAQSILQKIDPKHILLIAQLHLAEGNALMSLGRLDDASRSNAVALQLAEKMTLFAPILAMSIRARAHNFLGASHAMQKQNVAALDHWQQAKRYAGDAGLAQIQYRCEGNIANLLFEQGDIAAALAASQRALAGLQNIGDTYGAARFIHLQSLLLHIQGDYAQAMRVSQESEALKHTLGDTAGVIGAKNQQVKSLLALGRTDILPLIQGNLDSALALNAARLIAYTWVVRCDHALAIGDGVAALHAAQQAHLQHEAAKRDTTLAQDVCLHEAQAYLVLGQPAQAQTVLAGDTLMSNLSLEVQLERGITMAMCDIVSATPNLSATLALLMLALDHGYVHHANIIRRLQQVLAGAHVPALLPAFVLFGL